MSERLRASTSQTTGAGQLLGSLAITLISIGIILGGFLLSRLDAMGVRPLPTEDVPQLSPTLFLPTFTPSSPPTSAPGSPPPAETAIPTMPTPATTEPPTPLPSPYYTPTPRSTPCGPPLDWITYYVRPGDTLFSLSRRFGVSVWAIQNANCLSGSTIYVGQALFLPPPPPTAAEAPSP